jgi:hypothetical protein
MQDNLKTVLTIPTPTSLWQLRADLLQIGLAADSAVWQTLDQFYTFLAELTAKSTAHQYSHFASLLDIGAVGGVAIQNLADTQHAGELWRKLLLGGLSESLMVLAARQYVKAWEGEMTAVYHTTAWTLYASLWRLSETTQPTMNTADRRQLIEKLLAPLHDEAVTGTIKAVLIGRLFQILLLAHLSMSLGQEEK